MKPRKSRWFLCGVTWFVTPFCYDEDTKEKEDR